MIQFLVTVESVSNEEDIKEVATWIQRACEPFQTDVQPIRNGTVGDPIR